MCTYVHQKIRTRFAAASKGPGDKLKVYQQNEMGGRFSPWKTRQHEDKAQLQDTKLSVPKEERPDRNTMCMIAFI